MEDITFEAAREAGFYPRGNSIFYDTRSCCRDSSLEKMAACQTLSRKKCFHHSSLHITPHLPTAHCSSLHIIKENFRPARPKTYDTLP